MKLSWGKLWTKWPKYWSKQYFASTPPQLQARLYLQHSLFLRRTKISPTCVDRYLNSLDYKRQTSWPPHTSISSNASQVILWGDPRHASVLRRMQHLSHSTSVSGPLRLESQNETLWFPTRWVNVRYSKICCCLLSVCCQYHPKFACNHKSTKQRKSMQWVRLNPSAACVLYTSRIFGDGNACIPERVAGVRI